MDKIKEYFVVFASGGIIYSLIEVVFRGFTHWTMTLTGGAALLIIYITNIKIKTKGLIVRCLAGCAIITSLEFIVGCIVNRGLHMQVWDYSGKNTTCSVKYVRFSLSCGSYSVFPLLCSPSFSADVSVNTDDLIFLNSSLKSGFVSEV